ncbi:MAG: hypothetical protein COC09_03955 [Gammaproteobacteria bacterium]|nr:hypothetical protein [Gammaproteobacteria bacterium]PCH64079.1 MAG: hypothetical protein COC09_03955 [Gammaproteobacteria bacterium]
MSDFCSSSKANLESPKRHGCPKNNKKYGEVSCKTILHHAKEPWNLELREQAYYFCHDPDCEVVYFGIDNSMIQKDQLRTKVGIKETSEDTLICYCFGVSKSEANRNIHVKKFIVEQTKSSLCSCSTYNPSGKCCLKDFPK